jgi:hypothetical protein
LFLCFRVFLRFLLLPVNLRFRWLQPFLDCPMRQHYREYLKFQLFRKS